SIRLLLSATLNKNAQQRLQHIGDMRLFLDQKLFPAVETTEPVVAKSKTNRITILIASVVAALIGAIIPTVFYFRTRAPVRAPQMLLEVALTDVQGNAFISPDAQRVAYIGRTDDGSRAIWVRSISSETPQKLMGTDRPGGGLIWSPDGRYLAFIADG